MNGIEWVMDAQSAISAILETKLCDMYLDRYHDFHFTDSESTSGDTRFPSVYVKYLPEAEIGSDLDGTTINGFTCTMQVEVYTSKERGQGETLARQIAAQAAGILKRMHFRVLLTPSKLSAGGDLTRIVARYRRDYGAGDIIA